MNFSVESTTALHVWAVLGPLVGAWYGSALAKRSQKKHWIIDNEKEEYRELLSALYDASNIAALNRSLGRETTREEESQEERSDHHLYYVLHTRLFIRDFLDKEKIKEKWLGAFTEYGKTQDIDLLRRTLRELIEVVVGHARELKT